MPMLNRAVLTELLTRHKQAKTFLVDAPMFAIQKDGKTAYLLGTDHSYDLAALPRHLLNIILRAKHVYTENIRPNEQEIADFVQKMHVNDINQRIISILRLNERELKIFQQMIDESEFGALDGALELHPNMIAYGLGQMLLQLIEQEDQAKEFEAQSMDLYLFELFDPQVSALEPYGIGSDEVMQDGEIAELFPAIKTIFIPLYELLFAAKKRTLSVNEKAALNDYKIKFRNLVEVNEDSDKDSYSADYYIHAYAESYEQDQELNQQQTFMATRNMHMLRRILDGFARFADKEVIFAPGADHFLGSFGLLHLLEKQGFTICKIEQNSELKPIKLCYQEYRKSYEHLKRSILSLGAG